VECGGYEYGRTSRLDCTLQPDGESFKGPVRKGPSRMDGPPREGRSRTLQAFLSRSLSGGSVGQQSAREQGISTETDLKSGKPASTAMGSLLDLTTEQVFA
jgi:hypothetical protein